MDLFTELENAHRSQRERHERPKNHRAEECHREWQRARDCERLTLTSLGFWKTNTKMTTKTTRTGSNLIHALDVFVDAITSEWRLTQFRTEPVRLLAQD